LNILKKSITYYIQAISLLVEISDDGEMDEIIEKSMTSLLNGNVIAVPTDTIYGVAALAQSTKAVDKMYDIKQRHKEKAVSICVGGIEDVKRLKRFVFFVVLLWLCV